MNKSALAVVAAILLCVGLVGFGVYAAVRGTGSPVKNPVVRSSSDGLPGLISGPAPWSSNTDQLGERLKAMGFSLLPAEGTAQHNHQHLDISIEGNRVDVPAGIGAGQGFISDMHTHDYTGIMHVESPSVKDFYLGQFFDVWGVRFSSTAIGGYVSSGDKQLSVYVNGKKAAGDPRLLKLEPYQEIFVFYGTAGQLPSAIPSSFQFPQDY